MLKRYLQLGQIHILLRKSVVVGVAWLQQWQGRFPSLPHIQF